MSWNSVSGSSTVVYTPEPKQIAAAGNSNSTAQFDGSEASTNNAIITTLEGSVDCHLFIERFEPSQSQFVETAQLTNASGNETFVGQFSSQGNEIQVSQQNVRIRVKNVDTKSGIVGVSGFVLEGDK